MPKDIPKGIRRFLIATGCLFLSTGYWLFTPSQILSITVLNGGDRGRITKPINYRQDNFTSPPTPLLQGEGSSTHPQPLSHLGRTAKAFSVHFSGLKLLAVDLSPRLNNSPGGRAENAQSPTQRISCPADVETLIPLLLRDLPSYANRISQRVRRRGRTSEPYSYMIVAGRPEFAPLTLGPGEYTQATPVPDSKDPQQVFITTLERQYIRGKAVELQQYHWLFLTQTDSGWRLAIMFSQIGPYPRDRAPSPPRDSSRGIVGQAIQLWLRDCRAGSIRPL